MSPTAVSGSTDMAEAGPSLKKQKQEGEANVEDQQPDSAAAGAVQSALAEPTSDAPGTSSSASEGAQITFRVTYGKAQQDVTRPAGSTIRELREEIDKLLGVPADMQKLMCKGKNIGTNDNDTLAKAGLKTGSKVLLIGSSRADLEAAKPKDVTPDVAWDVMSAVKEEPLSKQTQHAKVLAKGRPDDGIPGIKDRQVPFPEGLTAIPGLMNSQGTKARLTFREDLQQLWVGSATHTQKVPYGSISRIESYPIEDAPEYSIVALCLGSSTSSRYWLYWFPSQHVAALKVKLIGVHALI